MCISLLLYAVDINYYLSICLLLSSIFYHLYLPSYPPTYLPSFLISIISRLVYFSNLVCLLPSLPPFLFPLPLCKTAVSIFLEIMVDLSISLWSSCQLLLYIFQNRISRCIQVYNYYISFGELVFAFFFTFLLLSFLHWYFRPISYK